MVFQQYALFPHMTGSFFGSYFEVKTRTEIGPCRMRLRDPKAPGEELSIRWPDLAGIAYPTEE